MDNKRSFLLCVIVTALLGVTTSTQGQLVFHDDFAYPDGDLASNPGWSVHSGSSGPLLVSGEQAVVNHGDGSEDVSVEFDAITTGLVYYGLDFAVDNLGAPYSGANVQNFVHFHLSSFAAPLAIVEPTGSGDFSIGVSSSSSSSREVWQSDLMFDTTYRAIVEYDVDADLATLWIDPLVAADPSVAAVSAGGSKTIDAFALRQADSSEDEIIRVDNVRVGRTFDDVVSVPEPSSFLSVGLSLLAGLIWRYLRSPRTG